LNKTQAPGGGRISTPDLFLRQSGNKPVPGHHRFDFLQIRRAAGIKAASALSRQSGALVRAS
jgi:hypothetical protein